NTPYVHKLRGHLCERSSEYPSANCISKHKRETPYARELLPRLLVDRKHDRKVYIGCTCEVLTALGDELVDGRQDVQVQPVVVPFRTERMPRACERQVHRDRAFFAFPHFLNALGLKYALGNSGPFPKGLRVDVIALAHV